MNVESIDGIVPLTHGTLVKCVTVCVEENNIHDFVECSIENRIASVREAGILRFDILQRVDSTREFLLFEAYNSPEAQEAHKSAPHYLNWRNKIEVWMAEPRNAVMYRIITYSERPKQESYSIRKSNWIAKLLRRIIRR